MDLKFVPSLSVTQQNMGLCACGLNNKYSCNPSVKRYFHEGLVNLYAKDVLRVHKYIEQELWGQHIKPKPNKWMQFLGEKKEKKNGNCNQNTEAKKSKYRSAIERMWDFQTKS